MSYKIKDTVWIHIGERTLTQGRVVDTFDLAHIDGYDADRKFYVIEIQTGIDNVFEVRDFDQISPDEKGPINLFRKDRTDLITGNRLMKKIGMPLPEGAVEFEPVKAEKLPGKKRFYAKRKTRATKNDQDSN